MAFQTACFIMALRLSSIARRLRRSGVLRKAARKCRFNNRPTVRIQKGRLKNRSWLFRRPASSWHYALAASPAVCAAAAFAAIVLELLLGHHGGVRIMPALLGNVIFIIRYTCHQVGSQPGGFPPGGEFTLHLAPPVVCRRGTPQGFLSRSAKPLCAPSGRCASRRWQRRRRRRGTMRSGRH